MGHEGFVAGTDTKLVAEVPRESIGLGFEFGRWSFFSCRLPTEQGFQGTITVTS